MQTFSPSKKKFDLDSLFYRGANYHGVMGETKCTFFVKIKTNSGFTNADYLAKAAELAKKYGDGTLERTTRQSVENQGVPGTNVDKLMTEIYASGLATIGMGYCTEGLVGQVRPDIDYEKCNGCGRCAELCRVNAISIVLGQSVIDSDKCISCGWCIRGCPHEAVIETERGYTMWLGGNDARRPADGIWLKSFCTKEEIQGLIDAVAKTLAKYKTKTGRDRLGNVMKSEGKFIKEVLASV